MTIGATKNAGGGGHVPTCGTDMTPPCPPPDPLVEYRDFVIDELAGPDASPERRCAITAQVDTFLHVALRGAFALLRGATAVPSEGLRRGVADSLNGNGAALGSSARAAKAQRKRVPHRPSRRGQPRTSKRRR